MTTNTTAKDGILINAQLGIFFKESVSEPDKTIWRSIEERVEFPTPTIMPVPNENKLGDVPIVQAMIPGKSDNNQIRVSIARKRMDIFIDGKGEQTYLEVEESFFSIINKIVSTLDNTIEIARVGFIVRSFVEVSHPNKKLQSLLSSNLTKLQKKSAPVETFVRYATRESISKPKLEVNNFTEYSYFKANIINTDNPNREGILIVRDVNTAPEIDYSDQLDSSTIKSFAKAAKPLLNFPDYQIWD